MSLSKLAGLLLEIGARTYEVPEAITCFRLFSKSVSKHMTNYMKSNIQVTSSLQNSRIRSKITFLIMFVPCKYMIK